MLKRTKLSLAVGAAISAGLTGMATSVWAQTTPPAQALERVEITGSLIRRIEGETALPVVTLSVDELQKAGVTNAEQAVKFITQNQGGAVSSTSVSGTLGGATYADLRSLGFTRTLVLLNGKRVATNPYEGGAVDLSTLPLAAVQRIETLTDGASATYGTDAISGVINFITRREYSGVKVGAEVQIPQESGGEVYTAEFLAGWGNLAKQGWNVYGGMNFRKQEPMSGIERDFMNTSFRPDRGFNGTSPTTFPANYNQPPVTTVPPTTPTAGNSISNTNPSLPGCFPPSSIFTGAGTFCSADTQVFTYVVPNQEQWTGFLRGSLALGANNTLFSEYFYAHNTLKTRIAPSPESGLSMTSASPFFPGNGITPITNPVLDPTRPISIGWRTTLLGARETEQETDTQRLVLGLEGSGAGWDYQANVLWSQSEITNTFTNGWPQTAGLLAGVRGCNVPLVAPAGSVAGTPGTICPPGQQLIVNGAPLYLNPFGPQTPEGLAYLQANTVLGEVTSGNSEMRGVTATGSRQFGQLPGGPISVALIGEFREEEVAYITDVPKVSQAASSGLAGSGGRQEGERDIFAFGVEFAFPVLKGLELGFAIRYDDYSDVGNTTNPKFTIRYTPTDQLLLRASYNTGFAAPSFRRLYLPNSTTFTANRYNDPVLCPGGVPNIAAGASATRDCGIQFQQLQGGNADLDPENSEAYTLGFVFQATPSVSFGIDYWDYRISESIGVIGEQTIFGSPAAYASLFVRCSEAPAARVATIGACRIAGGDPLAYITNTFQNLGITSTSGLDFQFNWQGPATRYGRFNLGARSTYVRNYDFQVVNSGPYFDPVGNYSPQFGGPVIRYQQVTTLGWDMSAWSATLFNRYLSGYTDQNAAGTVAPGFNQNKVQDYSTWDLSLTYTGFRGLTLRGGVLNVLNTDPPYSNQSGRFQARSYDDRFYSPLGRVYTLAASYEFF